MLIVSILKTLLVGFCAAAPIGPVALLVMQQTLEKGRKGGLVAGLGSMCADTLFAAAGLLTITYIRQFVDRNTVWIYLVGGAIVTLIGALILVSVIRAKHAATDGSETAASRRNCTETGSDSKPAPAATSQSETRPAPVAPSGKPDFGYAARTFLSALANPVALGVMIALLSFFKIGESGLPIWLALVLVACGEMLWWTLVTWGVKSAGKRMSPKTVRILNLILGAAVAVFGIVLVIKGLIIIL